MFLPILFVCLESYCDFIQLNIVKTEQACTRAISIAEDVAKRDKAVKAVASKCIKIATYI